MIWFLISVTVVLMLAGAAMSYVAADLDHEAGALAGALGLFLLAMSNWATYLLAKVPG